MVNRWKRGRAEVDQLLAQSRLTRVAANRALAESYLAQARSHLARRGGDHCAHVPGTNTGYLDPGTESLFNVAHATAGGADMIIPYRPLPPTELQNILINAGEAGVAYAY